MQKRRVLSCVLSAFIICSITCGPISVSATYNTLDDMEIDPWGDLEDIQGFEPPTPELAPDDFDPVTMYPDMNLYDFNAESKWIVTGSETAYLSAGYGTGSGIAYLDYEPGASQFAADQTFFKLHSVDTNTTGLTVFLCQDDFTFSLLANRTFEPGEYILSGELSSYLYSFIGKYQTPSYEIRCYPYRVDVYSGTSNLASFDLVDGAASVDTSITVTDTLTNIGYRFYFSEFSNSSTESFTKTYRTVGIGLFCNDGFNLEKAPDEDPSIGLLEGIIEWLKSIRDGILELPQNIANFILEGLQGLFIPDQEELTGLMDKYDVLFEERLGFIYQMFSFVVDAFTSWVDTMKSGEDYSFVFPGISVPYNGETLEVLPETEVSLENAAMDVLRPVLGTVICMVAVVAFGNTCFDLVVAFMSGQSYFQFISGKKEEDAA